jgi:tyrosyl-tRNA synthetase
MIRKKCREIAHEYLMKKMRIKGSEMNYPAIQRADYLLQNEQLTIEDQRKNFSIRNKMVKIP